MSANADSDSQRHGFTGTPCGVRVLWHLQPLVVDRVARGDHTLWGRQRTGSSRVQCAQPHLEPVRDDRSPHTASITYKTHTIGY